jgi:hypothetical protein
MAVQTPDHGAARSLTQKPADAAAVPMSVETEEMPEPAPMSVPVEPVQEVKAVETEAMQTVEPVEPVQEVKAVETGPMQTVEPAIADAHAPACGIARGHENR